MKRMALLATRNGIRSWPKKATVKKPSAAPAATPAKRIGIKEIPTERDGLIMTMTMMAAQ
jgi:hypothetical protein